jgi:hypothetical protein
VVKATVTIQNYFYKANLWKLKIMVLIN